MRLLIYYFNSDTGLQKASKFNTPTKSSEFAIFEQWNCINCHFVNIFCKKCFQAAKFSKEEVN